MKTQTVKQDSVIVKVKLQKGTKVSSEIQRGHNERERREHRESHPIPVRRAIERKMDAELRLSLARSLGAVATVDDERTLEAAALNVEAMAGMCARENADPHERWARLVVAALAARQALDAPTNQRDYAKLQARCRAIADLDHVIRGETDLAVCYVCMARATAHLARAGRGRGVVRALALLEEIEELRL